MLLLLLWVEGARGKTVASVETKMHSIPQLLFAMCNLYGLQFSCAMSFEVVQVLTV